MDGEGKSEIKVKLVIADFECSPEEITKILEINPTKTWLKGEPVLPTARNFHKQNGWVLQSPNNSVNSTVDAQVESLLSIIAPHVDKFATLPKDVYIELSCVIFTDSDRFPAVGFSYNTIRMLAKISGSMQKCSI